MAAARRTSRPSKPRAPTADRDRAARADEVGRRLARAMPEPRTELDSESPWRLLVATILSAQSTDKTVNRVTPALFRRFPDPAALAAAPQEDVEELVRPTGFFRNKAKAIRAMSQVVVERFGGELPRTLEEMVELPGVARKTANVVLGSAYGIATGIVVDTHAARVAQRLALTAEKDPVKIEADLCALFPRESWIDVGHRLVLHGRYVCVARKPKCVRCPLNEVCPSREQDPEGSWEERALDEGRVVAARGE